MLFYTKPFQKINNTALNLASKCTKCTQLKNSCNNFNFMIKLDIIKLDFR